MTELETILEKAQLTDDDIVMLLGLSDADSCAVLSRAAYDCATRHVGDRIFYRGLIEVSNICVFDCRYCGIRKSNHALTRYSMTREEIVQQAVWAAEHGYGSICLQAGERDDPKFVRFITECLKDIHERTICEALPEGVGVTLSLGDQETAVYEEWADAAGNPSALRYLSRFETSNEALFNKLHEGCARRKTLAKRFECFEALRRAGYQLGTGVMIGIPGQSLQDLCNDIRLFQKLDVDMIGMGPYLMSEGGDLQALGQMQPEPLLQLALNMLAVTRLVLPDINMAAATALQAIREDGRELGIRYGANVVMPNLSPQRYREGYQLYDNKPNVKDRPEHSSEALEARVAACGRRIGWNLTGSSRRWKRRVGLSEQ